MKLNYNIVCNDERLEFALGELIHYLNQVGWIATDLKCELTFSLAIDEHYKTKESFFIQSVRSENELIVSLIGHDQAAVLYAVYELLERLGYGFYPDCDTFPKDINTDVLNSLLVESSPAIEHRGMFVIPWFDDLPMYGIYWGWERWEQMVSWMAKQKMNLLRLHIFPTMGFFPLEKYSQTRPKERYCQGKRELMHKIIQCAHDRNIEVALSFYPNAVTREFAQQYPGMCYNAWYTYFACLDYDVVWDYSKTTVREMIEIYHPDYIELVTTEVHCPKCGWEKFSNDQIRLFQELIQDIVSAHTKLAIFPFVFPMGYQALMELLQVPEDTILFTETSNIEPISRGKFGGHYIACFEENTAPFMRFKIQDVGIFAKQYAQNGSAAVYYITGFSTKNYEITATAAGKQFWDPYGFDMKSYLKKAVNDRFYHVDSKVCSLLVESLQEYETAWDHLEKIVLGNGEPVFGYMPSVANSNYRMFLNTYASFIFDQSEKIIEVLRHLETAICYLKKAQLLAGEYHTKELRSLALNQRMLYDNYMFLLKASKAFILYQNAQKNYKDDLWGKHRESEQLTEEACNIISDAMFYITDLVDTVAEDPDYHDVKGHVHPYQDPGASVYHNHSGFTLEVLEHRLDTAKALADEMRALKDKLILERTFQGPHRPFVIPNRFQMK